ncbi:MAG TPA: hypothetical protein VKR59_10970 [Terriglobales bacterium]|nr:hypothetical protein [Terriglobales bacterium]
MNMDYEKAWQEETKTLGDALQRREKLDAEIEAIQTRVDALEVLVQAHDRHNGRMVLDQQTTPAEAAVGVMKPRVSTAVKNLLGASNVALTSAEIVDGLKRYGHNLGPDGQPLAFVFGICRRLVEQKFAKRVEKAGKVAWIKSGA